MNTSLMLLQWLLYMNPAIGLNYSYTTENCFVFDSLSAVKTGNRVCNKGLPADAEINRIRSSFGATPFTWLVDARDSACIELLEKNDLHYKVSLLAMTLNLDTICACAYDADIKIVKISFSEHDIAPLTATVSQAFNASEAELFKLFKVLNTRIAPAHLKLYVGYYQGKVAASGMAIAHGDVVSLHWIGTVSEYRNKGLGRTITHKALVDAQAFGCKQAILLASALGKPIYERLGFKEYGVYAVYGNY